MVGALVGGIAMRRELVERELTAEGPVNRPARKGRRSVTVNIADRRSAGSTPGAISMIANTSPVSGCAVIGNLPTSRPA